MKAIRPTPYAALDLKKLQRISHPHRGDEGNDTSNRESSIFFLPRALFALAYLGYAVFGAACLCLPPLAAEEAAGVAIPSGASCLRATRNADFTTVEIGVGTPTVQFSLLLRLDSLLEANSSTAAMRLFSQEALESSTVSCSSSGDCEDILLLSHGVNSGFRFAVGRFGYTHPAKESSVASGLSGVAGELRLREGNAYWLSSTHLCWKESHAGPSTGGLQAGLSASRRLQASVEALAAYEETSTVPAAHYAQACDAVANESAVDLFPVSAGIESSWLSIMNGNLYNSEPDSVEERRLVAEVGVPCAANISAMAGALSLYKLDCEAVSNANRNACRSMPSVPFRRAAFLSIFLDARSEAPRVWLDDTRTLRGLPKLASTTNAFLFSLGKLALITLSAAIVYVRSKRPTASSSWLFKHCMKSATADGPKKKDRDSSMSPLEDMAIGGVAVVARATIAGVRFSTLAADGQLRVILTEFTGALLSAVHWVLRYFVLEKDEEFGELPISKLGGSTAIVDSTAAVMLAFSEAPILVASLGRFDPTARLLVGILISTIVVSRVAFSACCCGILLDAEDPKRDPDRAPYIRILSYSGGAWVAQSLCLSVLMADTLVTPAAYSMSRSLVGSQLPSRLLLFAALVCSGLPRLTKTFRNIMDDEYHSD